MSQVKIRAVIYGGIIAIANLLAAGSWANAATYTFTNVTLSDGGLLNGTFTTGVYGGVASWDLMTSGGSLPAEIYSSPPVVINAIAQPSFSSPTGVDFFSNTDGYFVELQLMYSGNILDGGATLLTGIGGPSFECRGWTCPSDVTRYVGAFANNESVTATPLPAALPLFATGLSALGLLGRRKRRKAAAAVAGA
jgi:hypothetical protein